MMETQLDLEALHKVQYDILVEFDRVCRKHGLTYFLAFGTLLGAIRHDGFIPWDDDIDTMMPYDDYVKLLSLAPSEWHHPYFLQTNETDKEYRRCFAKVRNSNTTLVLEEISHLDVNHGVDIDIYPLVHLADDESKRKKQYLHTMLFMLLRYNEAPRNHGKVYYYGGKILLALIPPKLKKKLENMFLKKLLIYQEQPTKEVYVVNGNINGMRRRYQAEWFKSSELHKFEDGMFQIPVGAKEFLEYRYGSNYMQPPEKKFQGDKLEGFLKVDLENPYTIYKGKYYCVGKRKSKVMVKQRL